MSLVVGSVFTGIGGFDEGFRRAGFHIAWMCERESFCQRVLRRHFPDVPLYDDVTTLPEDLPSVDVLVGGFPCQDVSVAGRREGLKGERSGLFFAFRDLAARLKPRTVVIENVPGLLSSHGGRDFYTVLQEMAELRFRRAYRILDSRYFGVAQRRRRVFVVLSAGVTGGRARTVLFEPESRTRGAQASAEAGARVAATLRSRSHSRGVNEPGRGGEDDSNLVAIGVHANQRGELRTSALAGSLTGSKSGKQYEGIMQPIAFDNRQGASDPLPPTLRADCHSAQPMVVQVASSGERARALTASAYKRHDDDTDTLIAATLTGRGRGATDSVIDNLQIASALTASAGHHGHSSPRGDGQDNLIAEVANTLLAPSGGTRVDDLNQTFTPTRYGVRRLTPLESERVQGFPDGWTCLCGEGHRGSRFCKCPDTPRFKALGNAVTMPVALWIATNLRASLDEDAPSHRGQGASPHTLESE